MELRGSRSRADLCRATREAVVCDVQASSGLEAVYVLPSTTGVSASYASVSSSAKCYRFSNLGGAYAEEIPSTFADGAVTFALSAGDMGYMVEDGTARYCFWVTDYSAHALELRSLAPAPEQDCMNVALQLDGNADEIAYYSINGRRLVLSRELKLSYYTLEWNDESFAYSQRTAEESIAGTTGTIYTPAPLCDTRFTLSGDRFLRAWGEEQTVESPSFAALTTDAHTRATQTPRDADNEQGSTVDGLGGSAPCEIEFEAAVSDAVVFRQWQISRSPDFGIVEDLIPTSVSATHSPSRARPMCASSPTTPVAHAPSKAKSTQFLWANRNLIFPMHSRPAARPA